MVLQKFQTTRVMQKFLKFHYFAHPVLVAVAECRAEINMEGLSGSYTCK